MVKVTAARLSTCKARPPRALAVKAALAAVCALAAASAARAQGTECSLSGFVEGLAGAEHSVYADGEEGGFACRGKAGANAKWKPAADTGLCAALECAGEWGVSVRFLRLTGRFDADHKPLRDLKIALFALASYAEGEGDFRDSFRLRAGSRAETALMPFRLYCDAAYSFTADEAFRISGSDRRHALNAGLTWLPRLSPLLILRLEAGLEHLDSNISTGSGWAQSVSMLASLSSGDRYSLSAFGQYRWDLSGGADRVFSAIFFLSLEIRLHIGIHALLEYGLIANRGTDSSEDFVQNTVMAGLRVRA